MHLIVTFDDLAPSGNGRGPAPDTPLARLDAAWTPLLQGLQPQWRIEGSLESLSTPAEQARARLLLGRAVREEEDGRLPWAAWARGSPGPWARLTPCHGLVGSDRITGLPPAALELQAEESRSLFDAVQPLFSSEGLALEWRGALEWQVGHDSLRGLPCASLDRMVGDSMQRWQGATPLASARLLRRLQNEAQMVLHDHPVNREREARRALTVNSLWLSDAGAGDQIDGAAPAPVMAQRWREAVDACAATQTERVAAWRDSAARDPHGGAEGPDAAQQASTLVLCGRQGAQAFALPSAEARGGGWWQALQRRWAPAPPPRALSDWQRELDGQMEPEGRR